MSTNTIFSAKVVTRLKNRKEKLITSVIVNIKVKIVTKVITTCCNYHLRVGPVNPDVMDPFDDDDFDSADLLMMEMEIPELSGRDDSRRQPSPEVFVDDRESAAEIRTRSFLHCGLSKDLSADSFVASGEFERFLKNESPVEANLVRDEMSLSFFKHKPRPGLSTNDERAKLLVKTFSIASFWKNTGIRSNSWQKTVKISLV